MSRFLWFTVYIRRSRDTNINVVLWDINIADVR